MLSRFPSTFAIIVEEVLGSTAVDNAPPKQEPLTLVRGFFVASSTNPRRSRTVQGSNRAAAHSAVSKATVRLCLARGFQRIGMSTKKDAARPLVWGLFSWWRYRTRTARPRCRRGNKHPSGVFVSARFPMRRNVYQERCRQTHSSQVFLFWWTVQNENRDKQRQGITMRAISCLLIFLTRRGILGSVQQIGS